MYVGVGKTPRPLDIWKRGRDGENYSKTGYTVSLAATSGCYTFAERVNTCVDKLPKQAVSLSISPPPSLHPTRLSSPPLSVAPTQPLCSLEVPQEGDSHTRAHREEDEV